MNTVFLLWVSALVLVGGGVMGREDCVVYVAIAPDLFADTGGDGPYAGLARDLVELVGRKAGCQVQMVAPDAAHIDMLLGHFQADALTDGARYTEELLRVPAILVGRDSGMRYSSEGELRGLKIGVGHGYGLRALAEEYGEGLEFVEVESDAFGLIRVALGELDLMLLDLATASQVIEQEGLTNMRLVARLGPLLYLRMKVVGENQALTDAVVAAAGRIAWYERRALTEKWLGFGALPFYRSPLFWRWATGLLLAAVALIVNVLLWNRGLRHEVRLRKQMARDILSISSDERARIGRDLHDSIGQQLVGVTYLAGTALEALEDAEYAEVAEKLERIRTHTEEAIREARFVVRGLLPVDLRKEGLAAALENLAADTNANSKVTCHLQIDQKLPAIPVSVGLHLFRIVQEAIGNALKHGEISEISIVLMRVRKRVCRLQVRDNGKGIRNASRREGMGLKIMRYRAQIIGGHLHVHTIEPHGTEVLCRFPVKSSQGDGRESD